MKTKKLASLLMLASCAFFTNGCKNDEPTKNIEIELNLPDKIYVNEEVDLASFIEIKGSDAPYKIKLDSKYFDSVDMDGTKLYPYDEGIIEFTVDVDGVTKNALINVTSHVREIFDEETKDIGYDYSIWEVGEDGELNGAYVTHGENYFFSSTFHLSEDKTSYVPGGYYQDKNGKVFSFSVSQEIDPQGYIVYGDPVFTVDGTEPDSVDVVNMPFTISSDDCIYSPKKEGKAFQNTECLIYKGDPNDVTKASLYDAISGMWGISKNVLEYYEYVPSYITFEVLYDEDGNYFSLVSQLIITYKGSTGVLDVSILSTDPEDAGCPVIDEYNQSGETPHGKDISAEKSIIYNIIDSNNFTATTKAGWFMETDNGLVSITDNPMASTKSGIGTYILDWFNANESIVYLVNENQVATFRENDIEHAEGYIIHDNGAYGYWFEEEDWRKASGLYAYPIGMPNFRGIVDPYTDYTFLKSENSIYENLFVNTINKTTDDGNNNVITLNFSGGGAIDLFNALFLESIPIAKMTPEEVQKYYRYDVSVYTTIERVAKFIEEEACYNLFNGNIVITKKASGDVLSVNISFSYGVMDEDETVYYYVFETIIDSIGTTAIPDNFPSITFN